MVAATTEPVRLPPGPRTPKLIQTVQFLVQNHAMFDNICTALRQQRRERQPAP